MTSSQFNDSPRASSSSARGAKSWVREILVGVSGTVLGAIVLTAMGLNSDRPATSEPGQPPRAQIQIPVEEASVNSPLLAVVQSLTNPPADPPITGFDPLIPTGAQSAVAPSVMGKWEQWIYHPIHQKWYSGGIYRVSIRQQRLAMSIIDNTDVDPDMVNSQGITNVAYSNGLWSFNSQLEIGEMLEFKLRSIDEDTFSGYCYENGQALSANTWRRVR